MSYEIRGEMVAINRFTVSCAPIVHHDNITVTLTNITGRPGPYLITLVWLPANTLCELWTRSQTLPVPAAQFPYLPHIYLDVHIIPSLPITYPSSPLIPPRATYATTLQALTVVLPQTVPAPFTHSSKPTSASGLIPTFTTHISGCSCYPLPPPCHLIPPRPLIWCVGIPTRKALCHSSITKHHVCKLTRWLPH